MGRFSDLTGLKKQLTTATRREAEAKTGFCFLPGSKGRFSDLRSCFKNEAYFCLERFRHKLPP
jgi:hypothetical protein